MKKEEYDSLIDAVNIMCRRCECHQECMGTGCSPRNDLVEFIIEFGKDVEE